MENKHRAVIVVLEIVTETTSHESYLKSREHGDIKVISDSVYNQAFTTSKRGNIFKMCRKESLVFY